MVSDFGQFLILASWTKVIVGSALIRGQVDAKAPMFHLLVKRVQFAVLPAGRSTCRASKSEAYLLASLLLHWLCLMSACDRKSLALATLCRTFVTSKHRGTRTENHSQNLHASATNRAVPFPCSSTPIFAVLPFLRGVRYPWRLSRGSWL